MDEAGTNGGPRAMLPGVPYVPGGGSASVSRPPRSKPRTNTGSLRKLPPVAQVSSQLDDVCARRVGDVEIAQMYVRTRAAPRVVAHRSGWVGVATSASATAFTRAERRQTMNWAVMASWAFGKLYIHIDASRGDWCVCMSQQSLLITYSHRRAAASCGDCTYQWEAAGLGEGGRVVRALPGFGFLAGYV